MKTGQKLRKLQILLEAVVQGSRLHWEDDITRPHLHKSFIKKWNLFLSIYLITAFTGWRKLLLGSTSACYLQSVKIQIDGPTAPFQNSYSDT